MQTSVKFFLSFSHFHAAAALLKGALNTAEEGTVQYPFLTPLNCLKSNLFVDLRIDTFLFFLLVKEGISHTRRDFKRPKPPFCSQAAAFGNCPRTFISVLFERETRVRAKTFFLKIAALPAISFIDSIRGAAAIRKGRKWLISSFPNTLSLVLIW